MCAALQDQNRKSESRDARNDLSSMMRVTNTNDDREC
jgi:hypothetical protein